MTQHVSLGMSALMFIVLAVDNMFLIVLLHSFSAAYPSSYMDAVSKPVAALGCFVFNLY